MLIEGLGAARDLPRLYEIVRVFVMHGFADVLRRVGLGRLVRRARREGSAPAGDLRPEQRLRLALESLGPTFVKLGQILASRTDLLPQHWTDELGRLFASVAPVPWAEVRAQLAEDFGAPPETLFAALDERPLAAASIAQVHRAVLGDGRDVVVKVRRPGITAVIDADLRLLARFAALAESHWPGLRTYRLPAFLRQFRNALRAECDLREEARNTERIAARFAADARVVIPWVHWPLTSERALTMQWLPGRAIDVWLREARPPADRRRAVAVTGADAVLAMVFQHGEFHADPHPANVYVLDDGRVGLLDFGMVGRIERTRRLELLALLAAVTERDGEAAAEILAAWSPESPADPDLLASDCHAFVARYDGLPLHRIDAGRLYEDLATLLRENRMFLPPDVALLLKALVTLEGLGRRLDPDFVVASYAEPFVRRSARRSLSPVRLLRALRDELRLGQATLPRRIRGWLRRWRRGQLGISIDVRRIDELSVRVERSANRMSVALVTAALIVGTAIVLGSARTGDGMLLLLGIVGFSASAVAGVWLLWTIRRTR